MGQSSFATTKVSAESRRYSGYGADRRLELQLIERSPWWDRRAEGAATHGDLFWSSELLKGGPCGMGTH